MGNNLLEKVSGLISFGADSKRAQLPEIEFVDVVNLENIDTDRVSQYMQNAVDAPYFRLDGNAAEEVADLWRRLPNYLSKRCHIPPFGLRFYCNDELYLQASLCWQCDNIYGDIKREKFLPFSTQNIKSQRNCFLYVNSYLNRAFK